MQQFKFGSMLCCAAMLLFLGACNNESDKPADATPSDTTVKTTDATPSAAVNTIVTTPQPMMVVTHKVADFDKWLPAFESHDSVRLANGIHKYVIGRGVKDPNMILVALKVDDLAKAKAFGNDPKLKSLMQKSGVTGKPTIWYGVLDFQDTATISYPLRSRTTFTVKDYSAWVKSFEEGKQERMDNGIIDRVYGHEADNDKKVILVTAVTDTTKAFAYYKSDKLKERRKASGAVTEPDRFLYTTVKRY